jgi:hypothetical protein
MTPDGAAVPGPQPSRDKTLVRTLVRAHRWRRRIESGQARSITDLAEQENVTVAYVCRVLPLTCLAPDIVEAILDGRQPEGLKLADMLGNGALGWEEQRASWGFGESDGKAHILKVAGSSRPATESQSNGISSALLFAPRNSQAAFAPLCDLGGFRCSCRIVPHTDCPPSSLRVAAVS